MRATANWKSTSPPLEADDGSRIPHPVALAIIRGDSPLSAFRSYLGLTLRQLADATGVAASYISEMERGIKPGSVSALARLADALGARVDSWSSTLRNSREHPTAPATAKALSPG